MIHLKKLRKAIMKIKSDSTPPEAPKDPENSLLMDFYKFFASPDELAHMKSRYLKGIGWGEVKGLIFEAVDKEISPLREVYDDLMGDTKKTNQILKEGAEKARQLATPFMKEIKKIIGVSS